MGKWLLADRAFQVNRVLGGSVCGDVFVADRLTNVHDTMGDAPWSDLRAAGVGLRPDRDGIDTRAAWRMRDREWTAEAIHARPTCIDHFGILWTPRVARMHDILRA